MIGWKPAERRIPDAVGLSEAKRILEHDGFSTHVDNPGHAILRREGTQLSTSGEEFPLEVAIAEAEQGLHLQIRYDTFVLFDTGDLDQFADEVSAELRV
jgi:hypothetical protein